MTTRVRTTGTEGTFASAVYSRDWYETYNGTTTLIESNPSRGSISRLIGLPYSSITDVPNNPRGLNPTTHRRRSVEGGLGGMKVTLRALPWTSGSFTWQRTYSGIFPITTFVQPLDAHISSSSGLKALAIARVPAYDLEKVNGYVALMEARELVNSSAVKAASGLAHLAAGAWKARSGGGLKFLSREGRRAISDLLRKLKPKDAKEAFITLLDALRTANAADMEWKYAIAPLAQTVHGVNKAVVELAGLKQELLDGVRVYGRAVEERTASGVSRSQPFDPDVTGNPGYFDLNWQKKTRRVAVASIIRKLNPGSAMYDVDWFNSLDVVLELNGLKPTLKKQWELLPLSFIVDWFWSVRDLLESLQELHSPIGTSFSSYGGMYSVITETTVTGGGKFTNVSNPASYVGSATRRDYDRNTDPLTGGPALYIPPLRLPTKGGQWFSMAQIAFQNLTGRHR